MRRLDAMWRSLPRNRWTLDRFGLSPKALPLRLSNDGAPEVFFVSIPKAGTHLLERALCLHPQLYRKLIPTVSGANIGRWKGLDGLLGRLRPGQVVGSHLRFHPEYPGILQKHGTRGLFLIRDPHDIVVSQIHYAARRTDHRHHDVFAALPDEKARLRLAIAGDRYHDVASIAERLDSYAGWMDACHVVRFEDLVGPQGGGNRQTQAATVKGIYDFLMMELSDKLLASISDMLFSPDSPTFRRGSIGGWRESFDRELEVLFDEVVGDRVLPYGYQLTGEA